MCAAVDVDTFFAEAAVREEDVVWTLNSRVNERCQRIWVLFCEGPSREWIFGWEFLMRPLLISMNSHIHTNITSTKWLWVIKKYHVGLKSSQWKLVAMQLTSSGTLIVHALHYLIAESFLYWTWKSWRCRCFGKRYFRFNGSKQFTSFYSFLSILQYLSVKFFYAIQQKLHHYLHPISL